MGDCDLPPRLVGPELVKQLNSGKLVASEVGATLPGITPEVQLQFLLELCEAYADGSLELDKFFVGLGCAGLHGDISSDLGNAIWLCSLKPAAKAEHLGELTAECVKKGKLPRRRVLELEEPELMAHAGAIANANAMVSRERRQFTALFYKQDKYNLLREENEGYAKLLTSLLSGGRLAPGHLPALRRELRALIGAFKLDPNRVCDLVLDAAERDEGGAEAWLALLQLFNADAPTQARRGAAGRGAARRARAGGGRRARAGPGPPPPPHLRGRCARAGGHTSLEAVLAYLSPAADALAAAHAASLEALRSEVAKLGLATTGGAGDGGAGGAGGAGAGGAGAGGAAAAAAAPAGAAERAAGGDCPGAGHHRPGRRLWAARRRRAARRGRRRPGGAWPRGQPPPMLPGGVHHGMPGPGGPMGGGMMMPGGPGGAMGGGGAGMGGGGLPPRGGSGGGALPPPAPAPRGGPGGGAGGAAAYEATYNVMPASQLELDARPYDRPLLGEPGGSPHLALLGALLRGGDWGHALLMLDWLQKVLGVQAASEPSISAALTEQLRALLAPVTAALFPAGPLGGSVLRRPPYSTAAEAAAAAAAGGAAPPPPGAAAAPSPPAPAPRLDPLVFALAGHLGVYLHRAPEALAALLRALRHELMFGGRLAPWMPPADADGEVVAQVVRVLAEAALPALSLHSANRGLAGELWDVLELLPFADRAEVYRRGMAASAAAPPSAAAGLLAVKAFKRIKARLALPDRADKSRKEVVRANAHLLAKVTHATPLQVAEQVMWWAGSSPNAVEPLAEVLKLPNPLTMDALTYMALYWWGRLGKSKMKPDGANEEDWVTGLANLVGYACRAHPLSSFDLSTIFQVLFDGIKAGDAHGMLLLRAVLAKMTGIDGPVSLDPAQAGLLCAGPVLTAEAIHSVANRAEPRFVKGRRAVMEVLTESPSPERALLVPLAVALAQGLEYVLFALPSKHIKEVAELHDRVNEALQQYLMIIEHCLAKDGALALPAYAAALPPLDALMGAYAVQPGAAWGLWRPVVAALEPELIAGLEAKAAASAAAVEPGDDDDGGELLASLAAPEGRGGAPRPAASGEEGELPEEGEAMAGVEGPGAKAGGGDAAAAAAAAAAALALPVTLADVAASVAHIDESMFAVLQEPLYMAFWSLRPEDVHVPTDVYDKRISEMEAYLRSGPREVSGLQAAVDSEARMLSRAQETLDRVRHGRGNMRDAENQVNRSIDNLTAKQNSLAEAKAKMAHFQALVGPLRAEREALVARTKAVRRRLALQKDTFVKQGVRIKAQNAAFIRHCLVPRLTRSVADAVYCHHFTMAMHALDVPHWPAGFFWDQAVTALTCMVPTVTEKEALCVGVFLTLLLQALQVWYFDKPRYVRECSQQTMRHSANDPRSYMVHEQFQRLFRKWQAGLHSSLRVCATSSEYLQKRNALQVMSKMIQAAPPDRPPMFPFFRNHNEEMQRIMERIMEDDAREDVKKMAQALKIQLHNTLDKCVANEGRPGARVVSLAGRGRPAAARKPPPSPGHSKPGSRPASPPPDGGGEDGGGARAQQPEERGARAERAERGAGASDAGDGGDDAERGAGAGAGERPAAPRAAAGRPPRPAVAAEDEPARKRARIAAPEPRPQQQQQQQQQPGAEEGEGGEDGELPDEPDPEPEPAGGSASDGGDAGARPAGRAAARGRKQQPPAPAGGEEPAGGAGERDGERGGVQRGGRQAAREERADGGGGGGEGRRRAATPERRPHHHRGGDGDGASAPASRAGSRGGSPAPPQQRPGGGRGGGGQRDAAQGQHKGSRRRKESHERGAGAERDRDRGAGRGGGGEREEQQQPGGARGERERERERGAAAHAAPPQALPPPPAGGGGGGGRGGGGGADKDDRGGAEARKGREARDGRDGRESRDATTTSEAKEGREGKSKERKEKKKEKRDRGDKPDRPDKASGGGGGGAAPLVLPGPPPQALPGPPAQGRGREEAEPAGGKRRRAEEPQGGGGERRGKHAPIMHPTDDGGGGGGGRGHKERGSSDGGGGAGGGERQRGRR
ncbi:THO2 [Scenedesmus sp. PABB004]|nr:THO2 [Scenedesmus sp. PABB004]